LNAEKADKSEKTDKAETTDKAEKADKTEKAEKTEKKPATKRVATGWIQHPCPRNIFKINTDLLQKL
jgi:hypothetical protein